MMYLLVLANDSIVDMTLVMSTEQRPVPFIRSLDTQSHPLPFRCVYAVESEESSIIYDLEKVINGIFPEVRDGRTFYRVNPNVIKRLLNFMVLKKLVREIEVDSGEIASSREDIEALERQERRSPFRFSMTGIPMGTVLTFTGDKTQTATVVSDTEIEYNGEKLATSPAALRALEKIGQPKKNGVQGPLFWEYNGKTLDEWRSEHDNLR